MYLNFKITFQVNQIDTNNSGAIDFEEFVELVKQAEAEQDSDE